jgi:hypothetical protein
MMLFHSFPRPTTSKQHKTLQRSGSSLRATAECVLASLLNHGFLCTPERLRVFPDSETQNGHKQALLKAGEPEFIYSQSRLCFTLCSPEELFESKIRGLAEGPDHPAHSPGAQRSHADLFGPYAVGLDPVASRQLGIVPTIYYSPTDRSGHRFRSFDGGIGGLNIQMIQRLKELRDVCILLAYIERGLDIGGPPLPGEDILKALNLSLPFEAATEDRVRRLSIVERSRVFSLFNIDRDSALSLVSFIEMMFSLFQETDSSIDATILAFYQQREWRLIHHMREGTSWYCLGQQPLFRNPLARARAGEIAELRRLLETTSGQRRDESYFRACWLLETVDDEPIREFVTCVIAPAAGIAAVRRILRASSCHAEVVAAEDLGYAKHDE